MNITKIIKSMKKQMIVSFENNVKSGLIYESLKSIDESFENNTKNGRENLAPTNNNATIKSNNHINCDNNLTI